MQYSFLFLRKDFGNDIPQFLLNLYWRYSYKNILNPLCYKLLFVLSVGFICSIYTASSIAYFKSIRFVLYFFFLYDIYRSTHFEIYQYLRLLKFLMGLVILQGVASIIQIFIIGERIEGYVGYMSSLGGSTATTFLVLAVFKQ